MTAFLTFQSNTQPYLPDESIPHNVIDLHCHVAGIGGGNSGCFVSSRLRHNWRFKVYMRAYGVSMDKLRQEGDALVVDRISQLIANSRYVNRAVLLALDGIVNVDGKIDPGRTEIYVPNQFIAKAAAKHTNLLFGASVNPYRDDALRRLEWAKMHGAVLVKWIPSIMGIDPSDEALKPFYSKLVQLDLPLLTHAGKEHSFTSSMDELCDPDRLQLPLNMGVKVIAAHIASSGKFQGKRGPDRLARLMSKYTNLFSDISSLTQINKLFYIKEALTRPEFKGRLLYGSDFPLINTPLVSPLCYFFRLSPEQISRVWREKNPWDADVLLKYLLGTTTDIFTRTEDLLLNRVK